MATLATFTAFHALTTCCEPSPAMDRATILEAVYTDLRRMAASLMKNERANHTLQPTALVHEAYIRLAEQTMSAMRHPGQLRALASLMMRRVLVNHAHAHNADKRGGGRVRVALTGIDQPASTSTHDLPAIDAALTRLAQRDERQAKIVEMRYFGGCPVETIAATLDISVRTVHREWTMARAWLRGELAEDRS